MARTAAGVAATAPRRCLTLAALLPSAASALTVGGAGKCGTWQKCPCTPLSSQQPAGRFAPGIRLTTTTGSSVGLAAKSLDEDDVASCVGTIDGPPLTLSDRWGSLVASSQLRVDADLERKLLGLEETNSAPSKPLAFDRRRGAAAAAVRPGSTNRKFVLIAGGVGLILALGASFLLGVYANSSALVGGVITAEAAPSLLVGRLLAAGRRAGVASMHLSVGFAAFQERIVPEPVAHYIRDKALPVALDTLKKMLLMEFWRRVWTVVYGRTREGLQYAAGKAAGMWVRYCPSWIQRGAKSLFKKAVEKRLQASAVLLLARAATGAGNLLRQYWYQAGPPSFTAASAATA